MGVPDLYGVERARAHPSRVQRLPSIHQRKLQAVLEASAGQLHRPIMPALVRVTDDVRQRLVHGQSDGTAFLLRKSENGGQPLNRASRHAQQARIAR